MYPASATLAPHADDHRRPTTYGRRLALAFAAVAAVTAALAAVLISTVLNYQFDQYLRGNLQNLADGVAQVAAQAYPMYGGWTLETLSTIPRSGSMRNMAVQILDENGEVIYDDTAIGARLGQMGEELGAEADFSKAPKDRTVTSPVIVNGEAVGTVRVWAYGPGAIANDRDLQFRRAAFAALTAAALIAIAFASVAGLWYANRLVRPIERITATAEALRSGERAARTGLSGDDEIGLLGRTFDEMADAIDADREMERRLTADVAHELRTPLQAIQATVEAMQDGVLPADEERLGIVRDETVRLARLADAILELTRLERGALPFEMRRLDVAGVVRAAADMHEALYEAAGVTLSVSTPSQAWVLGDPDRLQQAIGNLLSNAARYTPEGGRVDVTIATEPDRVTIEVADTGIGIAETDMNRVFGRFWRADEARATATGGLGIGLAVTKEIVERHRGTIGVKRREPVGTAFTICIPAA